MSSASCTSGTPRTCQGWQIQVAKRVAINDLANLFFCEKVVREAKLDLTAVVQPFELLVVEFELEASQDIA